MAKQIFIIAGPNGAGKTTASFSVLPTLLNCKEFVNADEIAKGLSPFNPEGVAIEAGRLMLQRINELLAKGKTFAIETTLATRSYAGLIKKAQLAGYHITLLFFYIDSPLIARQRVAKRVSEGGHDIPADIIERRFFNGLKNLFDIYMPIVDFWTLYDNNHYTSPIANKYEVINNKLFSKIQSLCQTKNI